ncbi:MAG: isoleucine--tRNA ligase, partial [Candidatus Babeliales bacterium]
MPEKKVSFKDTLNLPRTDFPIRANPKKNDPEMIKRWEKENLFEKTFYLNKGNEIFILHDGPPYANGNIHIGHAYNKILKDIVTKAQRMLGKQVPVTPGWDCHGLPIELKVTKEKPGLAREELKKACRKYAQKWVDIQREEFKELGVLMNWAHPYLTMNFSYEASVLRAFGNLVEQNYIERANKTVPWCPSCQTVLASAEIEYKERKDPSIYVLFPLEQKITNEFFPRLDGKIVNFLIWTTTPWTLPLNRAVLLKPDADYVLLAVNDDKYIIVGKQLADKLCKLLGIEENIIQEFNVQNLITLGPWAQHPFIQDLLVPVILDNSVALDEGTACVHCAPGAGPQDYEVGIKNNLAIYSPVGPAGIYTEEVEPKELVGKSVTEGQGWVIKKLAEKNKLLFKTSIRHSYPHCWRCHNGLIFRATKQWFCDLSKGGLKEKALNAIDTIEMLPESSKNRFKATLEGRLEWCLSRQRIWGIPIPALICQDCDFTYISKELIENVANHVEKSGIEWWDTATINDIMSKNFTCPSCNGKNFKKEQDILDVWFDSGVSHFAVLMKNPNLRFPANIYLEGKDQHRGWFQSSLLTSMAIEKEPCMNAIVTHGFAVDEHGHKMSKSIGNVVSPQEIIDLLGTDGLRLWASSIDCRGEAVVSDTLLRNVQEVLRKIRNTCRFLLSNIYDFSIENDAVDLTKMKVIDKYALQELLFVNYEIIQAYTDYDFTAAFHRLSSYSAVNLSSFYLGIIKDRLYVEKADGKKRRSAQTACWYILDTLTRLIAPILSFTAEQVSDCYQQNKTESIHLQQFANLTSIWELLAQQFTSEAQLISKKVPQLFKDVLQTHGVTVELFGKTEKRTISPEQESIWHLLKKIRSALLKAIELKREKGLIKDSLEVKLVVYFDPTAPFAQLLDTFFSELEDSHESVEEFFKEFLIVSNFDTVTGTNDLQESELKGLWVNVEKAPGEKCSRCWQWDTTN